MAPNTESPSVAETTQLLQEWETEIRQSNAEASQLPRLIVILGKLADVVEMEMDNYMKQDPDPFDDRHPVRADPDCAIGIILKTLFKNENFMNKLVGQYILDSDAVLTVATARLLLDIMPGVETNFFFQGADPLINRLFQWAKSEEDPISLYAAGLLARAMENQDIAASFRERNNGLIPILLKRLHRYREEKKRENQGDSQDLSRPFAEFGRDPPINGRATPSKLEESSPSEFSSSNVMRSPVHFSLDSPNLSPRPTRCPSVNNGYHDSDIVDPPPKRSRSDAFRNGSCGGSGGGGSVGKSNLVISVESIVGARSVQSLDSNSNSSWAEMERFVIGTYRMNPPLATETKERLIILYLTAMGEYQEVLGQVLENNALSLILQYVNLKENSDVCLAFEALKYLGSLLCHKKFAIEFLNVGGVQELLKVPRPSMAATGVSMCLYYLAYFEDAMERACLLPSAVLREMVKFCLWLLECSHESGRCHATMFFSASFQFRVILELFDAQGGLRTLLNVMSRLEVFANEESADLISEDELYSSRQLCRHVAVAFRRYFEAHLCIMSDSIRRSTARMQGMTPPLQMSAYRSQAIRSATELMENLEMAMESMPASVQWEPVNAFLKLGGIPLFLKLIALCGETNYNGRSETVRSALDVLTIGGVVPKVLIRMTEMVKLPDNQRAPGMNIILSAAHGEIVDDASVRVSALQCINMCVSGPKNRMQGGRITFSGPSIRRKTPNRPGAEDILVKMWESVRSNNGIMVLLNLLATKTPVTEADLIRSLACRALVGLARHDRVRQIISKLPLFNSGQLQSLMREPVLHDKRLEHAKFCKYGTELLERVTGKSQTANIDDSVDRIRKADAVSQTKIVYHEDELLCLIHQHLTEKGYHEAAEALQKEAMISTKAATGTTMGPPLTPVNRRQLGFASPSSGLQRPPIHCTTPPGFSTPTKRNVLHLKGATSKSSPAPTSPSPSHTRAFIRQKTPFGGAGASHFPTPVLRKLQPRCLQPKPSVTLDTIVTDYLRKQHAVCRNPVVVCPPFSLFSAHRCPEPRHKRTAPASITARLLDRACFPSYGGLHGRTLDRKLIHSKFRSVRTYRDTEQDGTFTSVAFSQCQQWLAFGTYAGELKLYNIDAATEFASRDCHDASITSIQYSRSGKLMITSSPYGQVMSSLWRVQDASRGAQRDFLEPVWSFDTDNFMEFGKTVQDKAVGTEREVAKVYDLNTGTRISQFIDANIANNYTRNRATFNSTDDLVLNDGILWDVRSGKVIHKFDKFNPHISGLFHPNDLEIIINSEVWDMKTFHLLRTAPALDQCHIRFSGCGNVIYAFNPQSEEELEEEYQSPIAEQFGSSFRTFDATSYENIATIDVKRQIVDMCIDHTDGFLAIIENQRNNDSFSEESVCRLYEVGRVKGVEEEDPDEEEEEDDEEDDDEDDDDDDDDDDGDDDLEDEEDEDDGRRRRRRRRSRRASTEEPLMVVDLDGADDARDLLQDDLTESGNRNGRNGENEENRRNGENNDGENIDDDEEDDDDEEWTTLMTEEDDDDDDDDDAEIISLTSDEVEIVDEGEDDDDDNDDLNEEDNEDEDVLYALN